MLPQAKKQLLIITHNIAAVRAGGGVEVYQEYLRDIEEYETSFLFPYKKNGESFLVFQNSEKKYFQIPVPANKPIFTYSESEREKILRKILAERQFDIVHFQHLLGIPLNFPNITKELGIPTLITAHDHYLICPKFTLVGFEKQYCEIFRNSISQCRFCLSKEQTIAIQSQEKRQSFIGKMLANLDGIIVNTEFSKETLVATYPSLDKNMIRVIEMLTPTSAVKTPRAPQEKKHFKIAIPGNFNHFKGADTLLRLIDGTQHLPIEYHILGKIQEVQYIQHFNNMKPANLVIKGGYKNDEIIELLKEFDISLHLSIWPETYMITINEAWEAGVIPIVSNLGAPAYRVKNGVNGFMVNPKSIGDIYDRITELINNPQTYMSMIENINQIQSVSPEQHVSKLKKLYDSHIS